MLHTKSLLAVAVVVAMVSTVRAADPERIWVEIEFLGSEDEGNYIQIGKMSKTVYDKIVDAECRLKFVRLTDCRYWDADVEVYRDYSDEEDTGEITIAVNLIVQIIRKKGDPLLLKGDIDAPLHATVE